MNIDTTEFQAAFFEEAAENLTSLEEGLLQLEARPDDTELIHGIFRAAHSIKGTGGAMGFADLAGFTHHVETVLDYMRQGKLAPTTARVQLMLRATDAIGALLAAAKEGVPASEDVNSLVASLQQETANGDNGGTEGFCGTAADHAHANFGGPAEANSAALFDEEQSRSTAATVHESSRGRGAKQSDSIRVSVAKVEELINLVGELVIANSMVREASLGSDGDPHALHEAIASMDFTTRQLQEKVMSVRMMPMSTLFRRFPRVVRDLGTTLGKAVNLVIEGEETELDKQVVEEVSDPLTHLIRNAVDHGLELPPQRIAAGKLVEGRIELRAYHEGGSVVVEVADDGAGINTQRVRRKAIDRGLIAADAELSDDEICQLIMKPGFTTAEKITDVSGRGVGLDVVKAKVESLSGSISISNRPGNGCTFHIRLPLTMAILDGLAFRLGSDVYVLPLVSVVESLRPEPEHIVHVAERGELIKVRGEPLPLIYTHRVFNVESSAANSCEGLVVIVEHQGRKYGLVVDELIGQLQVVMKSLEANYERVEGISGATILGDGRIAMIVDIAGVVRLASSMYRS